MSTQTISGGLAVRYRPRRFADVVGQRHATTVLRRAISAGRVPQQLLFSGSSGLGKTTLARVVAAAMLCENPVDGDACGACVSCDDITRAGSFHPDVIEFDAASHGSKDQIRELATRAATTPIRGAKRIYIIDEAHGLTRDAGSAFLKLLEEPPPHVVFMLATTDPEKMLRTNRGRCVEFELVRPTDAELAAHLVAVAGKEGWELSESSAAAVLAATDTALGVRGALMTLEKLADALAWGADLDDDELATLLGVAPASLVASLTDAIDSSDRAGALQALGVLRRRSSDEQIRAALRRWARARLTENPSSRVALWAYEQIVRAAPGSHWTDVVVCRLATPAVDPSVESVTAHLADASDLLARLDTALSAARDIPAARPPVDAREPEQAGPVVGAGTRAADGHAQRPADPAAALLAALNAPARKRLSEAHVSFEADGDVLRIVGPDTADAVLAELRQQLIDAAPDGMQLRRARIDRAA